MNFISYVRMCNRNVVIVRHHSNNLKHLHAVPLSSYAKHVEPGSERKSAGERGLQTSVKPRPNGLTSRRKSKQVFYLRSTCVSFGGLAWWKSEKARRLMRPDPNVELSNCFGAFVWNVGRSNLWPKLAQKTCDPSILLMLLFCWLCVQIVSTACQRRANTVLRSSQHRTSKPTPC